MGAEGALTAELVGESIPRTDWQHVWAFQAEASVSGVTEIGVVGVRVGLGIQTL